MRARNMMTDVSGRCRRWELVGLLWLAFFLNQADRQVYGVVLPQIRSEFHLSDVQSGLVATVFALVFAALAPVSGWLGDRFRREAIVVASLLVFSTGTLLTGLAPGFVLLLLFRGIATGAGESLYTPAANALLCEHHVGTRGRALSLHQTANYTGVIVSGLMAGFLADHFGWRSAFLVFGATGLVWTMVIRVRLAKPTFAPAPGTKPASMMLEAVKAVFSTPALTAGTIGFSGFIFIMVGYLTWSPTLLFERFHLSLAEAGFQSLTWHHAAAYIGILMAGAIGDRFCNRWPRFRLIVTGLAMLLFAPFLFVTAAATRPFILYAALAAFGFFRGIFEGSLYPAVLEQVEDRLRASVTGVIVAIAYLIGAAAPTAMGLLKRHYGMEAGMDLLAVAAAVAGLLILGILQLDRRPVAPPSARAG